MESKVIADILKIESHEWGISIDSLDTFDTLYIDTERIPDLIAALQSFLPKETE